VDCFAEVSLAVILVTCSADVFNSIAKMEIQSLVSDEVPRLDVSPSVVGGA